MSKILVSLLVPLLDLPRLRLHRNADARHMRAAQGHYGYGPGYSAPRSFPESPTYAPDVSSTRSYDNPGIPDFQKGSRG
jgi:hypothetical protein